MALELLPELRTKQQILRPARVAQEIAWVLGAVSQEQWTKTKICIYNKSQYHNY